MKVFGIAGWSGSGKTTLLEKLIPALIARGLKVSVIKHAHHGFDIDKPGKDSYRHREAGAAEVMLACGTRWALMHECRNEPEPQLADLLSRLAPCDLVLVEGFKQEPVPKLEVHRPANGKPPLFAERDDIVAVASDEAIAAPVPLLPLNDIDVIADFIIRHLALKVAA
jgi:molybdopterin-guanine dinucleotide biosynthesis protein B